MPRSTKRLHKRRLGGPFLPRPTGVAATPEPHELDEVFVFWPDSLGPKPSDGPALVRVGTASRALRRPSRPKGRRALVAVAFTTLFFGGAAFTASAGDKVAGLLGATSVGDPAAAVGGGGVEGAAPAEAPAGPAPRRAPGEGARGPRARRAGAAVGPLAPVGREGADDACGSRAPPRRPDGGGAR